LNRETVRRAALMLAGLFTAAGCLAQAPAEDRRLENDAISASQQRISTLLNDLDAADAKLKSSLAQFTRADHEMKDAAAKLDDARKRKDGSAQALKAAQQQAERARKAYETESTTLQRLRRPPPAVQPGAPGAEKRPR
jgi:septal ring factor EnvC (AmiA/AmiB activator)